LVVKLGNFDHSDYWNLRKSIYSCCVIFLISLASLDLYKEFLELWTIEKETKKHPKFTNSLYRILILDFVIAVFYQIISAAASLGAPIVLYFFLDYMRDLTIPMYLGTVISLFFIGFYFLKLF
jgi:hypothetical protein